MNPISFNGIDGSGKTTQIELLGIRTDVKFHFAAPLVAYTSHWPRVSGETLSKWWFEDVEIADFIRIVIASLNERFSSCPSGAVPVFDRGTKMFQAVCAATWATRLNGEVADFVEDVSRMFADGLTFDSKETELFLRPSKAYFESISRIILLSASRPSGNYSDKGQKRYALYQKNLLNAVMFYFKREDVDIIDMCMPIVDIHNIVRDILNDRLNTSMDHLARNMERVIGLGGMSESGKSSFGDHLRLKHEFYRLKIRYFSEMLKSKGVKPTPSEIALEFLRFIEAHYYVRNFSLESLHSPDLPAFFKLLFGNRYQTVYIDTDFSKRVKRTSSYAGMPLNDVEEIVRGKDRQKDSSGAREVANIAELVFDNNSDDLVGNLTRFSKWLNL